MDQKLEFNTLLSSLVEEAMNHNKHLEKSHIDEEFAKLGLKDAQMPDIYQYLRGRKIEIDGFDNITSDILDEDFGATEDFDIHEEEAQFLDLYQSDLAGMEPLSDEEQATMLRTFIENADMHCFNNLAEQNLQLVMDILPEYTREAYPALAKIKQADLIQEGNLGLLEGIRSFQEEESVSSFDTDAKLLTAFKAHLQSSIRTSIQNAIDFEQNDQTIANHLADRANMLDRASTELAKKLGRQPSLKELSEHVSLPEDEVANILKYSIDAMTINVDIDDQKES